MTKKNRQVLESIWGQMIPEINYLLLSLHSRSPLRDRVSVQQLKQILLDEQKKKNPLIIKRDKIYWYRLPGPPSSSRTKVETDDIKMARAILKIVKAENKKFIQNWIENEFEKKLDLAVQKFVKDEFRTEVLPVLIDKIDEKIKSLRDVTKGQVKECITEVLSDIVKKLT